MIRGLRHLMLIVGAFALVAAPCAPALAVSDACPMMDCDGTPFGAVSSADCCCAASSLPAPAPGPSGVASMQLKTMPCEALKAPPEAEGSAAPASQNAPAPSTPVPLFLLNASLLN